MVLAVTYDNALQFNSAYFWYTKKYQINGECRTLSHSVKNNMQRPENPSLQIALAVLVPKCPIFLQMISDISKTCHLHNLPLLNYMLYIYTHSASIFLQVHPCKPRPFSWGLPYKKAAIKTHGAAPCPTKPPCIGSWPAPPPDIKATWIVLQMLEGVLYHPWGWHIYPHLVDCYGKCIGKYASPMDGMVLFLLGCT